MAANVDIKKMEEILWNSRKILTVPKRQDQLSLPHQSGTMAASALRNLEDLGFKLDLGGVLALMNASDEDVKAWYFDTEKKLREIAGSEFQDARVFYPDFPDHIADKSAADRYFDQALHYLTSIGMGLGNEFLPDGENPKKNVKSLEEHKLKVLTTVSQDDHDKIITTATEIYKNLLKTKANIPYKDFRDVINPYIEANKNWLQSSSVVANRETLCYLYAKALLQKQDKVQMKNLPALVTNDYLL